MAFPVTLNGRTYTLTDFSGTNYVEGFPDALEDFVTQAGDIYNSTSTTSNAISTGTKTFTVEASKPYQAGTPLRIADAAAPATNFLDAIVTSYSGTSLVVSVFGIAGSGTYTSWTVNIGGAKTLDGTLPIVQGGTGATTATNARTNLDTYSKGEADSRFLNVSGEASNVVMNGNVTIGDAGTDTLTVNATATLADATLTTADINGGTIDGVTIGGASAGAVTTTSLVATTADINGGTIDGTVIGGSTPAAISGTTGTFSGNVTLPSINGGPLAGFRNAIINGNFDHWQRGTSGTGGYLSDRWRTLVAGSTAAISRQAFTLGQTDVPNEPEYFHRVVATSVAGAGNLVVMQQRVEDVRTFAGQTVTLSFFAKADAAKNMAVEFAQDFGVGGSAFVSAIGVTTIALTTAWQKFTVTVANPSIAGKTIGSQSSFDLSFFFDAGSNFNARTNSLGQQSGTFDIAQVQLEAGSVATPFERRPVGTELALCQRYFQVGEMFVQAGAHTNGVNLGTATATKVTMRATPAVGLTVTGSASLSSGPNPLLSTPNKVAMNAGFNSTTSAFVAANYTADAEL